MQAGAAGGETDAARQLLDDGAELAQCVEVEVDRTVADAASAEVRDECLTETVQERSAEQDRNAGGTGVGVDLLEVGRLDIARVEDECTRLIAVGDPDTVHLEQRAHHRDIADGRDVAQHADGLTEQRGDHRLGREVLRSLDVDAAAQRAASTNGEDVTGEWGDSVRKSVAHRCRHSEPHFIQRRSGRGRPRLPRPAVH